MAHYQIALDSSTLHQLFLGGSAEAGMKPVLESILNQVLKAQAKDQIGAGPYERRKDRQDFRNGFYSRTLQTLGPLGDRLECQTLAGYPLSIRTAGCDAQIHSARSPYDDVARFGHGNGTTTGTADSE